MRRNSTVLVLIVVFFLSSAFTAFFSSPQYPGGTEALEKYLRDSLRFPESEKKLGHETILSVAFDVSKDGKVTNPSASTIAGVSSSAFDKEGKRLALAMPEWEPGTDYKGKKTATRSSIIVRFDLPDSLVHLPPFSDDTTTYSDPMLVDSLPLFPGGTPAMYQMIANLVRYPQMEKETGTQGTVYIAFTVGKNGLLYNVYAERAVENGAGLTKESIRVVKAFPRFRPALKNGKAVKFKMIIPIRYILQ